MIYIENAKQYQELLDNNHYVIVDFFATWCGPCRMISPILEEIEDENQNIIVAKIDVDKVTELASKYAIASIPTIFFVKNGEVVHEQIGFISKSRIEQIINSVFNI